MLLPEPQFQLLPHPADRPVDLGDASIGSDIATVTKQPDEMTHHVEIEMAADKRDVTE
jgi:hypothetical protein